MTRGNKNRLQRAKVQRDAYFYKFVDFQSLGTTVVLNSEMSNDGQNFIGIPYTSPYLVLSKTKSPHKVC